MTRCIYSLDGKCVYASCHTLIPQRASHAPHIVTSPTECIACAAHRNESESVIRMTGAANNSRGGQRQYATTRRRPKEGCGGDSREEGWAWAVKDVSLVASEEGVRASIDVLRPPPPPVGCGAYGIFNVFRGMEKGEREKERASEYRVRP